MKGGQQQPADYKIRVRLGRGGPNPSKRYNDPNPDKRDDFRGGPGHGGMMPMDRGDFHHERDREFMPPY